MIAVNGTPLGITQSTGSLGLAADLGDLLLPLQVATPGSLTAPPPRPPYRIDTSPGTLVWPQGASRFAVGQYIVSDLEVAAIWPDGFTSDVVSLTITPGDIDPLTFALYPLQLLPLSLERTGTTSKGLYLLVLVDDRYFLQTDAPSWTISEGTTTWALLDAQLNTFLDGKLTADSVPSAYLKPGASLAPAALASEGVQTWAGPLLDAIAIASGRRFVAFTDGTFALQNWSTATTADATSLAACAAYLADGGLFAYPPSAEATDGLYVVPVAIDCVYPEKNATPVEIAPRVVTTLFAAARSAAGYAVADTAVLEGVLRVGMGLWGDGSNDAALDAHALQWSTDWYGWLRGRELLTYAGPVPFTPSGFTDCIVWTVRANPGGVSTRVERGLLNPRPGPIAGYSGIDAPPATGTLTVQDIDGVPSYTATRVLEFDYADGFTLSQPSTGVVRVDLTSPGFTVDTVDGAPSYTSTYTLRVDEADGFVISQPSAGIVRVDLAAATDTQAGIVSTTTQTFGGDKTFYGDVYCQGPGSPYNLHCDGITAGVVRVGSVAHFLIGSAEWGYIEADALGEFSMHILATAGGADWGRSTLEVDAPSRVLFSLETVDASCTDAAFAVKIGATQYVGASNTDAMGNVYHGGLITSIVTNAATARSNLGAGTGSGSVTSVGLSLPGIFTVTVTPVTSSGTLTAILATQAKNTFLVGPITGANATPTFRVIDIADIPTGSTSTMVCIGNDSRLSDSRTPTGSAGGGLSGTYPNPVVATASAGFTVSGGTLVVGVNDITCTGSLGATGARLTTGWFTDLQVTNAIAGSVTGNAATVTVADAGGDTTCWPLLATSQTGNQAPATDAGLTYNATSDALTATTFVGALSGNATTATSAGTCTGNSATVTVADAGGDTTTWVLLGTSQTGSLAPATDADLTYNATTNALTATTFIGALTGNASTATALATARAIYGNNFDGTAALAQIIASTYGGTGNGFTKFSGPGTSEKTFTLPNASAAVLTDNAAVTVAQGGTGVGTLTTHGVLLGQGTGNVTALALGTVLKLLTAQTAADPSWTFPDGRSLTHYGARGHYTGAGTNFFVNNTWTTILLDTQDWANGVTLATGSGRFTCPVAGYYLMLGQFGMGSMVATNTIDSRWLKNAAGTPVTLDEYLIFAGGTGTNYIKSFTVASLAANDTIDFQGIQVTGGSKNSTQGTSLVWATVILLQTN